MAGITLADAQDCLDNALALAKAFNGKTEMTVDGVTMKYADVKKDVEYWNAWVIKLDRVSTGGGIRVREVIPR